MFIGGLNWETDDSKSSRLVINVESPSLLTSAESDVGRQPTDLFLAIRESRF